jgi:hypothetical protein
MLALSLGLRGQGWELGLSQATFIALQSWALNVSQASLRLELARNDCELTLGADWVKMQNLKNVEGYALSLDVGPSPRFALGSRLCYRPRIAFGAAFVYERASKLYSDFNDPPYMLSAYSQLEPLRFFVAGDRARGDEASLSFLELRLGPLVGTVTPSPYGRGSGLLQVTLLRLGFRLHWGDNHAAPILPGGFSRP